MNLSKEIIIALGFEETKVNEFNMYRYCTNGIKPLYLEKTHKEKEFYMIYKENEGEDLETCGHCEDLASLLEIMMRINHIDSMELGKELKQREIKSALGLN